MKKLLSKRAVIVVLAIFMGVLSLAIAYSCFTNKFVKKIFTNQTDFERLKEYEVESIEDETPVLKEAYTWSYCKILEYNGERYEVYAYIFTSSEYAKEYYKLWSNVSDSYELEDWDFALYTSTDGNCSYMLYSDNRLFRINGKDTRSLSEFVRFFTQDFKEKLN